MSRMVEKVPGWVERLLIPTLESRIRTIVKDEFGHFEKVIDAKFEGIDAKFDAVDARFDSLEKRFPLVEQLAEIKARLAEVERKAAAH